MNDDRNPGKLCFIKVGVEQDIYIYWNTFQGQFGEHSWKASISFSENFSVPEKALKLLSNALHDSTVQVVIELDDGRRHECVIHSIDDLADSGLIEISSPGLGRVRLISTQ